MSREAMMAQSEGPAITLPTGVLLASVVGPSVAVGLLFVAAGAVLGMDGWDRAGIWGSLVVALCTSAGVLAITPWRPRPVSLWISIWLGQTVVRLLLTPAAAYLLYSATSIRPMALAAAVGSCYLAAVLVEARVLARILTQPRTGDGSS